MDNFIDRITNRFSGQDAIKANAEAEAYEMRKLKSQTEQAQRALAQYDACMQEMRKLNLRNAESAQAVQTLIDNAQVVLRSLKDTAYSAEKNTRAREMMDEIKDTIIDSGKKIDNLAEKIVKNEKAAELADKLSGTEKRLSGISEKMAAADKNIIGIGDKITALEECIAEVHAAIKENSEAFSASKNIRNDIKGDLEEAVHKENVKVYRNVQAALSDEVGKQTQALMDDSQGIRKLNKALIVLVAVSLVVGLGNLGVLIAQLLGFL